MRKLLIVRDAALFLLALAATGLVGWSVSLTMPPPVHHHSWMANVLAYEMLGLVAYCLAGLAGLALYGAYITGTENFLNRYCRS